jgi:hypothetical protein
MKKRLIRVMLVMLGVVVLVLSLGATVAAAGNGGGSGACNGSTGTGSVQQQQNKWQQKVTGGMMFRSGDCVCAVSTGEVTPLSQEETDWLTFMREEEKLARDVYLYMYNEWGLRIFNNIAVSEQRHFEAVGTLLDRYSVEDPAAETGLGEFNNEDLQNLYNTLIGEGSGSIIGALGVGVTIEEKDIADLLKAVNTTTHQDLETVFNNLLQASEKHLNAFNSTLERY